MDRIFEQAKDKNVAAVVIYYNGRDNYAYKDGAYTTKFKREELLDACLKGAVITSVFGVQIYAVPIGFSYQVLVENPTQEPWTEVQFLQEAKFSDSDSTMVCKVVRLRSEEYSA